MLIQYPNCYVDPPNLILIRLYVDLTVKVLHSFLHFPLAKSKTKIHVAKRIILIHKFYRQIIERDKIGTLNI